MSQHGFGFVLGRECRNSGFCHVGWIGDDQIVAPVAEVCEHIGEERRDAVVEPIGLDVLPRDGERIVRNIGGIDGRILEGQRGKDRKASRSGAQIEDAPHWAGAEHQHRCVAHYQFADIGSRHDDAFVDVERVRADPSFVGQVRSRFAGHDTLLDDRRHLDTLGFGQARIEPGLQLVDRQVQCVQDQIGSFILRIRRAVSEHQFCLRKPTDCKAQPVSEGDQLGSQRDLGHGG